MTEYIEKYWTAIKESLNIFVVERERADKVRVILNKIYEDGFTDGQTDDNREPPEPLQHNEGYD